MEQIRIVIADDSDKMRERIRDGITVDEELTVVGTAQDGFEACDMVRREKPDVLLLDLIMPKLDGLSVLERLFHTSDSCERPDVIVISAVTEETIIREAFEKGARYYFIKPFNMQALIDRIKTVMRWKDDENCSQKIVSCESGSALMRCDMERAVTDLFHELGIPAHLKGYQYLRDAVLLTVCRESGFSSITKDIYPIIAKENHANVRQVERAMRNAIEIGWSRGNIDAIHTIFKYTVQSDRGKPTNSEFIALIADWLRTEFFSCA